MIDSIEKIFNHLLLNIAYTKDYSLYYGKTGCLLFFAHYARLRNDEINDEIVSEIINDIFSSVHKIPILNIQQGICGIGWGVEYILQHKLLSGNSDEILFDLDKLILNQAPSTNSNYADILRYISFRLTSSCGKKGYLPFPHEYLLRLYHTISNNSQTVNNNTIQRDLYILKETLNRGRFSSSPIRLTDEMIGIAPINQYPLVPLGLNNGLSGLGIKWMLDKL